MIKVLRVYLFMGYIRRFFSLLSILFGLEVLENGIFYSKANYIYIFICVYDYMFIYLQSVINLKINVYEKVLMWNGFGGSFLF